MLPSALLQVRTICLLVGTLIVCLLVGNSIFMGNVDVPTQNNQPVKMAMGTYEFGANLVSSKARSHARVGGGR